MKTLISFSIFLLLIATSVTLDAQKTYKAVCDKSDGTVKIVDGEDRSPNLVPLKGGFPFYQVAENWVKENFPNGKCDPAAAQKQNQAAADAVAQQATAGQPSAPTQSKPSTDQNAFFGVSPGPTPVLAPAFRYNNTSVFFSLAFSNLGKVYSLDPPMIPGMNFGIEQLFGTKFYGGTGIHINTLIGKTDEDAGVSSFYFFRIPLFAGYRQVNGNRYWGVDLGLAANTMLRPLTAESDLSGEYAADYSLNTITRVRVGNESSAFEFGVDVWLNDILSSYEGFQMTVLSVGYRYSF
jgi:hypothetical protein